MTKFLIIIAVIVLVVWILKSQGRKLSRSRPAQDEENMVRCAQCGVHLPKSESLAVKGDFFCSEAHRQLHRNGS